MKNKLKLGFLFLLLFLPFLAGCEKKEETHEEEKVKYSDATPLLYKVTDGKTDIYLMGSIHAADKTAYEFNQNVLDYYNEADALAVELDMIAFEGDLNAQINVIDNIMYTDGRTIQDDLDETTYNELVSLLKNKGLYMNFYDMYKPILFTSALENALMVDAGLDSDLGIDMYFLKKAKKDKKKIIEVESAEFQYEMMGNLPDYAVIEGIKEVLNDYDAAVEELKELYEVWKSGNLEDIEKLLYEEEYDTTGLTQEELVIYNEYIKMMITDRNIHMADVMEDYLKEGTSVFCVVGLAHVVSEGGMADLLEKRGYTVELVDYSSK